MTKAQAQETNLQSIYDGADHAGKLAAENKTPSPMVVSRHASPLDDASPVVESYYVPSGVCGFAWVQSKGNTAFGKFLLRNGYARRDEWKGGVCIWVSDYGQSYEKKLAYAAAFANYVSKAGIKGVYADSRLD